MDQRRIRPEEFSPLDLAFMKFFPEMFGENDLSVVVGRKFRVSKEQMPNILGYFASKGVIEPTNQKRKEFKRIINL